MKIVKPHGLCLQAVWLLVLRQGCVQKVNKGFPDAIARG